MRRFFALAIDTPGAPMQKVANALADASPPHLAQTGKSASGSTSSDQFASSVSDVRFEIAKKIRNITVELTYACFSARDDKP